MRKNLHLAIDGRPTTVEHPVSSFVDNCSSICFFPISSEIQHLQETVDKLTAIVQGQQTVIDSLTNKLKFVLSFLDITDSDHSSVCPGGTVPTASSVNDTCPRNMTGDAADNAVLHTTSEITIVSQQPNQSAADNGSASVTYANITARNRENVTPNQPNSLLEAVVAAVYADQRDKERRARSVIVSGLALSSDSSDAVGIQRLCMLEFGIDPLITHTRRLGSESGRVRPLLVGVQSADVASQIVSHAKKLRSSSDDYVRNNVFINRNLTKVEARLAYEERCRRRHHRLRSDTRTSLQSRGSSQLSQPSIAPTVNVSSPVPVAMTSTTVITDGRHR